MLTYLLDTSAWIAHIFKEPGWEYINTIFEEDGSRIGICVVSLAELHSRLKALNRIAQFQPLCEFYRPLFDNIAPVDESVALRAIELKNAAPDRLPSIDAFIAAAASLHNAVLVHCDAHFSTIPKELFKQYQLPGK
jgi:predicted nucleic acid-binding protein